MQETPDPDEVLAAAFRRRELLVALREGPANAGDRQTRIDTHAVAWGLDRYETLVAEATRLS